MGTYRKKMIIEEVNRKLERRYLIREQEEPAQPKVGQEVFLFTDKNETKKLGYVTILNIIQDNISKGLIEILVEAAPDFKFTFGDMFMRDLSVMGRSDQQKKEVRKRFTLQFTCNKGIGTLKIKGFLRDVVFCEEITEYYAKYICNPKNLRPEPSTAYKDTEYTIITAGVENKVKKDDILLMIQNKTINKDTKIWRPGMPDWVSIQTLPEFKNIFMQQSPPSR